MPRFLPLPLLLVFILLAGCAPGGAEVSSTARQALIGMKTDDLQACAGIPTRSKRLEDGSELLSYEQKNGNTGGVDLTFPVLGGFSIAGSGSYCHALFRVAQGRVIGLNYAGDNDDAFGQEGVCAPLVRGCLRQPVPATLPPPERAMPLGVFQPEVTQPAVTDPAALPMTAWPASDAPPAR